MFTLLLWSTSLLIAHVAPSCAVNSDLVHLVSGLPGESDQTLVDLSKETDLLRRQDICQAPKGYCNGKLERLIAITTQQL